MREKVIKMILEFLCGAIGSIYEMSFMREGRYKAGGREPSVLYQTHNNCGISVRCDVSIRWASLALLNPTRHASESQSIKATS